MDREEQQYEKNRDNNLKNSGNIIRKIFFSLLFRWNTLATCFSFKPIYKY